jgi:hypothetical protein
MGGWLNIMNLDLAHATVRCVQCIEMFCSLSLEMEMP